MMTQTTEDKALALMNEVNVERGYAPYSKFDRDFDHTSEALCRAIEQHEAFRQEVSEIASSALIMYNWAGENDCMTAQDLRALVITKPDPLVALCKGIGFGHTEIGDMAENLNIALDALGYEIREKG
jgi:hypothetical protein